MGVIRANVNRHYRWITWVAALTASVWLPARTRSADVDQDKKDVQQTAYRHRAIHEMTLRTKEIVSKK